MQSAEPAAEDPHNGYIINGFSSLDLKGFRINDDDVASFKFVKSDKSYAKGITGSTINNGVIGVKVYEEKTNFGTYALNGLSGNIWKSNDKFNNLPSQNITYSGDAVSSMGINNTFSTSDGILRGITHGSNNISDTSSVNYSASISNSTVNANCLSLGVEPTPADFNLGTGWGKKQTQAVRTVSFEVGNLLYTNLIYYASKEELEKMGIDMGTNVKVRSTLPSAFGEQKYCPVPKGWQG